MNSFFPDTYHSLPAYFYHWVATKPDEPFLRQPYGKTWKTLSYKDAFVEAGKMAQALQKMGLQKGDHVAIYSKNCYHWILADLAIMMGGFVSVPLYHSLSAAQLEKVLHISDAKALFAGKLDHWGERGKLVQGQFHLIRFPHYQGNAAVKEGIAWDALIRQYEPIAEPHRPQPEDLWTILFTSGTTGSPKGVMHPHKTPVQIIKDDAQYDWIGICKYPNLQFFSYLPLNHVGERIGIQANAFVNGATISFAESIDTFIHNLQEVQPTLFFSVPRMWTKFYLGVAQKLPLKRQQILFKTPIINSIIKKRIKKGLGLSNAKVVATGAAITPAYLKKWFQQLDIHLVEAYGMTEVCGQIANSPMLDAPLDSVGKAAPRCEIKIDDSTGELLLKSPYMMLGYYQDPALTEKVFQNGWLRSGDRGTMDQEGFIRVIGRVSDAFKTSKGKFIAPSPIEEQIEQSELIEQVCVAGLGLPQPIALVNLSEIGRGLPPDSVERSLSKTLEALNRDLANYQKVSTIVIDQQVWDTENAILTPTMKIRRGEIDRQYGAHYLNWHEHPNSILWH